MLVQDLVGKKIVGNVKVENANMETLHAGSSTQLATQ